jgi:hypothetical protein
VGSANGVADLVIPDGAGTNAIDVLPHIEAALREGVAELGRLSDSCSGATVAYENAAARTALDIVENLR